MVRRLFTFTFILLLFACGHRENPYATKTVFRLNESSGITSLDPAFAKDQPNTWACVQLYNGLLQLDNQLLVQPCIARSWEIADSGHTYTFHLRQDVFFHENRLFGGKARNVVAKDFVYSFTRLLDSKIAAAGAWVMNNVKREGNILTGLSAPDDSTLIIHLQKPFPPFLGLLTMPYCSVIPHEVADHYGKDFSSHPCGTGPFKFMLWKEGVKLIYHRNENYFEADSAGNRLPYLDAVETSFINDKQSAFIEFLKGNLDFMSGLDVSYKDELLTRNGALQSKYRDRFIMETQPYQNTEYLGILMDSSASVMKNNPLRSKAVRQALNYGFDRKKMMAYLRNNMGTAGIYGLIPPGMPSFDSTRARGWYDYNPQRAGKLLNEAGFPDGRGLPEIVLNTTTTYQDLCEYIKSQWEELGFKVKIDVNQSAVHRKMLAEQKLAFFRASWVADYPDAENYLSLFYSKNFAPGGPNYTHFSNSHFDDLYEKATTIVNDSLRFSLYQQMDSMMMEEAPIIILYYDKVLRLYQNNIKGLGSNAMNLLILKKVKKINGNQKG